MADFKISQLPVASNAAAGDFMIINKGNSITNRIDVKEFVDEFVDGNYLDLNAGTNEQTVAGSGKVIINGLFQSNKGIKIEPSSSTPADISTGMRNVGGSLRFVTASKDVISLSTDGQLVLTGTGGSNMFSITGDVAGAGSANSRVLYYYPKITGTSTATVFINAETSTNEGSLRNVTHYYSAALTGSGSIDGAEVLFNAAGSTTQAPRLEAFKSTISPDVDNYSFICSHTSAQSWFGSNTYFCGNNGASNAPVRIIGNIGQVQIDNTLQVGRAPDYWSGASGTYIETDEGMLGTQGNNAVHLTCGGYRGPNGTWVSKNVGGLNGASQIQLDPNGTIRFNSEAEKLSGASSAVETKAQITTTNEFSIGNKGVSKRAILSVNGEWPDDYDVPDNSAMVRVRPNFSQGKDSGGLGGGVGAILVETPTDFHPGTENYCAFRAGGGPGATNSALNNFGFFCDASYSSIAENTNGFGFYSNINANLDRRIFNFYSAGTAGNYFRATTYVSGKTDNPNLVEEISDDYGIQLRNDGVFVARRNVNNKNENCLTVTCKTTTAETGADTTQIFAAFKFIDVNGSSVTNNIQMDGSGQAILATASDYRAKENVASIDSAIDKVKALRPITFNYNWAPGKTRTGFIAHELAEVIPCAVVGTKDDVHDIGVLREWDGTIIDIDVDEPHPSTLIVEDDVVDEEEGVSRTVIRHRTWTKTDTVPNYQSINEERIIPVLTRALQEALEEIDNLKARLDVLEGN